MEDPAPNDPRRSGEIAALLARHPSFGKLGHDNIASIAEKGVIVALADGEVLFEQGDLGRHAYLVTEGSVRVDVTNDTGTVTVAVIGPGGVVGEIGAFASSPRTATIRAEGAAAVLRIGQVFVRSILARNPDAAMAIIADLGERFQSQNAMFASVTQATRALAEGRVDAATLDDLRKNADRYGHFVHVFSDLATEIHEKHVARNEMRAAALIQASFIPTGEGRRFADDARFAVRARMTPARDVGGDFYDYFRMRDGRIAVAVGDVSGKGVPAAMFMGVSRMVLRTVAERGGTPGEILAAANARLAEDNAEAMFVTLALGLLEPASGALAIASGGHEEILVLRAGGRIETLGATGPALGIFDFGDFETTDIQLAAGDSLVLATDGVTEAIGADEAMLGFGGLESILGHVGGADPEALAEALVGETLAFQTGRTQSDDITALVLRYAGAS